MKILLLNPSYSNIKILKDPILTRCSGAPLKAPYIWPPIGLAYIASALRKFSDSEVKIVDAQVDNFDIKTVNKFDMVVINAVTCTINHDIQLSQKIKELNGPKTTLIGAHAAYFHKELIKYCDFIARGESDAILVDLARSLNNRSDINEVRGLTWKNKNKIIVNKYRKPIENLDSLPFQAIDLLSDRYFDIFAKKHPIALMITSRYCPFQCTFCAANYYSKKYKSKSTKHIFEEILFLLDKGYKDLLFFDDSFTIDRKRLIEICDLLYKEKLDITWRCMSRTDQVDKETLEKMKNAGCYQIYFGVESGDQRMLDLMKKGLKLSQIENIFKLCDNIGIETVGHFILGYPGESLESITKTVQFAFKIKPDFLSLNLFTPLPGSEIFDSLPKREWEDYNFRCISFCDILSKKIHEITRKVYRNYYLKPSYILRRIIKTKEPFRITKQSVNFWTKKSGLLWDIIK